MKVPAFNLDKAVTKLRPAIEERWRSVLSNQSFVGGAEVERFEAEFASFLGSAGCVGVANGTDALTIALRCLQLQPNDEVLVPSFTFIASAGAVVLAGGRPRFVDVASGSLNLDLEGADALLTAKTVGVIGVHLYGQPFDVDGVLDFCDRHGLWLIEDAAQAHGAQWRGKRVGNFGRLATWSFYPSKNLGCFGDGGAITGNDPALLQRARSLANHGRIDHYHHREVGTNSRLDGLQAAVLSCRLQFLEADNERRRRIASHYRTSLTGIPEMTLLDASPESLSVYHQFTLRTSRRDGLREALEKSGIGSGVYYPMPLHLQPAFVEFAAGSKPLPESELASRDVLSLPMYPELEDSEVDYVCAAVGEYFAG